MCATRPIRRLVLAPFDARIFDGHLAAVGLKLHEKVEPRLFLRQVGRQALAQIVVGQRIRQRRRPGRRRDARCT